MGVVYGVFPYVYEEPIYFYVADYKIYIKKKLANRILKNNKTISFPIADCYLTQIDHNVLVLEPGHKVLYLYEDRDKQIHTVDANVVYRGNNDILMHDMYGVYLYGMNEKEGEFSIYIFPDGRIRKEVRQASGRL